MEEKTTMFDPVRIKPLPALLGVLTFLSLVIGGWFYWDQLGRTSPFLAVFVPDCPLYVLLGSFILLFDRPRLSAWRFMVASALALYGSWTVFVLLSAPEYYFAPESAALSAVLVIGHLGMVLQGLLVLPKKAAPIALFMALAWLGLNTFMDYRAGPLSTHPPVPSGHLAQIELFTWAGTLLWPLALYLLAEPLSRVDALRRLREALSLA